ncbi:hypothetical protein HELRODRAFT_160667 [Helobdella robusta]|uniref:Uncharacterized protein n=1 Tax=Helobdella robusta TaxID=6412 RepID=T1EQK8_HELRO|nr:hypothetical protein HELRODRAFT_160667 [Helobdella robusta]ESO06491.1 hypothetical protein HELRODRAFT_160667 [Helobdella robusta]
MKIQNLQVKSKHTKTFLKKTMETAFVFNFFFFTNYHIVEYTMSLTWNRSKEIVECGEKVRKLNFKTEDVKPSAPVFTYDGNFREFKVCDSITCESKTGKEIEYFMTSTKPFDQCGKEPNTIRLKQVGKQTVTCKASVYLGKKED